MSEVKFPLPDPGFDYALGAKIVVFEPFIIALFAKLWSINLSRIVDWFIQLGISVDFALIPWRYMSSEEEEEEEEDVRE